MEASWHPSTIVKRRIPTIEYHAYDNGLTVCGKSLTSDEPAEANPPMHLRCLQCVKQLAHAAASEEGEG